MMVEGSGFRIEGGGWRVEGGGFGGEPVEVRADGGDEPVEVVHDERSLPGALRYRGFGFRLWVLKLRV